MQRDQHDKLMARKERELGQLTGRIFTIDDAQAALAKVRQEPFYRLLLAAIVSADFVHRTTSKRSRILATTSSGTPWTFLPPWRFSTTRV